MKIEVTQTHLSQATKYKSPVALALIDKGFSDPHITKNYIYLNQKIMPLPEVAKQQEILFDYKISGGVTRHGLTPYTFELGYEQVLL